MKQILINNFIQSLEDSQAILEEILDREHPTTIKVTLGFYLDDIKEMICFTESVKKIYEVSHI